MDKWDINKVIKLILIIGQFTIIWCLIKILRIYLIEYVKRFNKFLFNNLE